MLEELDINKLYGMVKYHHGKLTKAILSEGRIYHHFQMARDLNKNTSQDRIISDFIRDILVYLVSSTGKTIPYTDKIYVDAIAIECTTQELISELEKLFSYLKMNNSPVKQRVDYLKNIFEKLS